jgi:hypothetical protein
MVLSVVQRLNEFEAGLAIAVAKRHQNVRNNRHNHADKAMIIHHPRPRPEPLQAQAAKLISKWALPFLTIEWTSDWAAYLLSRWSFLAVLEYLGSFSVLVAVIFYFGESGDRVKQKHYQAWQVINTAQGKGGSGGRVEALQELNADGVPLVGVDVSGAFLQGIRLGGAHLTRSNFSAADVRDSKFRDADFSYADLHSANFRGSDLGGTELQNADLRDADLHSSSLSGADLDGVDLSGADLRDADLSNLRWKGVKAAEKANLAGVRNAPADFLAWARSHGAIEARDPE